MVEQEGTRKQKHADTREDGTSPVDTQSIKHLGSEQGEDGTKDGSKKSIRGDSRSSEHEVGVNDVVETLKEDEEDTSTDEDTSESWHNPVDCWVITSPGEPKEANWEEDTTNHGWRQTVFRYWDSAVGFHETVITWFEGKDHCTANELTNDETDKWKVGSSTMDVMVLDEDNRVGGKQQIKHTIDESNVERDEKDDRLGEEQPERTGQVLLDQLSKVNFDLLLFSVDSPVLCQTSESPSLPNEDDGGVCLFQVEKVDEEKNETDDGSDPLCPSPAKVAVDNKCTGNWSEECWGGDGQSKDGNGITTMSVIPNIGVGSTNNSQRSSGEETSKEATNDDSLKILSSSDCDLENRKTKGADENG